MPAVRSWSRRSRCAARLAEEPWDAGRRAARPALKVLGRCLGRRTTKGLEEKHGTGDSSRRARAQGCLHAISGMTVSSERPGARVCEGEVIREGVGF